VLDAIVHRHLVDDIGGRRDEVQSEFPLQTLANDLQVKQPEEAAAEPETQRGRGLRFEDQRGIVEFEFVQCVAQFGVIGPVDRVQPRENHGPRVPVAPERLLRRVSGDGDGVAYPGLSDVLDTCNEVADFTGTQRPSGDRLRADDADLEGLVSGPGAHHGEAVACSQRPIDNADVGDHSPVGVVHAVKDQSSGGRQRVTHRRRYLIDHCIEQVGHTVAGLGADSQDIVGITSNDVGEFRSVLFWLGTGQVDLVEHRDDVQIVLEGQVQIGQGLRLDALGRIDQQHRTFAGGKRPRDLVGEVHVARRIDEVELVVTAVTCGVGEPNCLGLNGDAPLAFDIHPIEVLGAHLSFRDHPGDLQHPVGKSRLAMIDVGDDAEVSDLRQRGAVDGLSRCRGVHCPIIPRAARHHGRRATRVHCMVAGTAPYTWTVSGQVPRLPRGRAARQPFHQHLTRAIGHPVANIKSQIKRNATNERRHERNKAVKSELRTLVRRVREAVADGDASAAREAAQQASRALDKAASKGVIHKNQAANRKSAVAKAAASVA